MTKKMENKRSIISTYASSLPSYYNLIEFKDTIYKENFKKTGVYRWTNLKNDKIYRGSSSNLGKRFSGYFSIKFLNLITNVIKRFKFIIIMCIKNN